MTLCGTVQEVYGVRTPLFLKTQENIVSALYNIVLSM